MKTKMLYSIKAYQSWNPPSRLDFYIFDICNDEYYCIFSDLFLEKLKFCIKEEKALDKEIESFLLDAEKFGFNQTIITVGKDFKFEHNTN